MSRRRWSTALGAVLLALVVAGPAAADGQRKPKAGSSSTRVKVQTAQPAPSSPPPRIAVPRTPSSQGQRQPDAQGERRPGGGSRADGWRHYPVFRGSYSWYPWGWWGWGWWGVWDPWYGPGYYPGGGPYYYPEQVRPTMGALDLDLRPEEVQVWLDGTLIGIADHFDGWPRYLWLDQGTYDLVFYLPGYQTLARQYTIYPGVIIDVEDRMQSGEAVRPEDLVSQSTERRDERLERRAERGETTPAPGDTDEPAWRDRVRAEREGAEGEEPYLDARAEPARLHLQVSPQDAAIYLDGRFVGTGDELVDVRAGMIVDPGEHEIEVVRPGYASKTRTFTAEAGEEVEMTVELEEE
jgi:hypothetical protein